MTATPDTLPNPGSDTALDAGCICAVLDNNHGKYPPFPPDGWWITFGCPVHAPESPIKGIVDPPPREGEDEWW